MDVETTALRPRRRFTVEDYYRMGEAGILGEDDRVELIEGEIVEMPPIRSPHAGAVAYIAAQFSASVAGRAVVWVQNPIRLSDLSEPVPDLCLLRPRDDFYRSRHPQPEDVLLVVEVADASAAYDRGVKVPLYARASIPECWIVELTRKVIEVHGSPTGEGYHERTELTEGTVAPAHLPGVELDVLDILG